MYQFDAALQTTTVKFPAVFVRFQTKERVLRVNKSKITSENTFKGYHLDLKGNNGSSKHENNSFLGFFTNYSVVL